MRPKQMMSNLTRNLYLVQKKHPLTSFITRRLFSMLLTLFILGFAVFGLMTLAPGDIVDNYVKNQIMNMSEYRTDNNIISPEMIHEAKVRLGLDKPFYIQYFSWIKNIVVNHDLGKSMIYRTPIIYLIRDRMINSITLNLISLVILTILSFTLGIYFSSRAGTKSDTAVAFFSLFLHAFPGILLMILLQLAAALSGWFPITAYPSFPASQAPVKFAFSYLYHIFLPLSCVFLSGIGGTLRMIRGTMLDQLGQPYITALRSRGVPEWRIYFHHAFRNTLNPYITGSANMLASLFSGSLIMEIIFSYPGIGQLMYEAVIQEDIQLVLANIMFLSFLVLLGMMISDILLAVVDPRIKFKED